MLFTELRRALRTLGRPITPDMVTATRALLSSLQPAGPSTAVHVRRDLRYGNDERQRLDIFTPASGADPRRPLLVFVHGGGFVAGDKHSEGSPFFSNVGVWAVSQGFNAVNITYRLAPRARWPSGVEDLRSAVDFLQVEGAAFGVGAEKLFLMGQSAGAAHVASYIAHAELYAPRPPGVKGIILLSGIYDYSSMPPSPMEPAYLGEDRSLYASRSSLAGLVASTVPFLVSLAEFDPPQFEAQTLQLLTACLQHRGSLPPFVYGSGQNHVSVAMHLGVPGDLLAPQINLFVAEHA
ncbi:MAG: hypothetical protein RLZZ169_1494 [Pseudomonadota bacterium]